MPAKKDQVVVTPLLLPGYLSITEIATLAGVSATTMRGYRATKASNMPDPDSRAGATPLWSVDLILDWLASRPMSPTIVEKREDGSLVVTKKSDYLKKKANGESLAYKRG